MTKHALRLVGLLCVALAAALFAPQRAAAYDEDDPPSRAARLSYVQGNVSFEPAGTDEWLNAVVNRPLTLGDKLWSDDGARAELTIDGAAIRLGSNTGFSFLNLDDRVVQIRLTAGTLNLRVRELDNDQTFEVDTPNLAFSILRPGNYKIFVNENGDSTVIHVRDGQGEVTGGGSAYTIHAREAGTFDGTDELNANIDRVGGDDDFDAWSAERDRRQDRSISSRYVDTNAVGYEDLDDYGGWRDVPDYGHVWFPHTTVVGWAPYRYGHWVWISPWGWTWVEDEPWGYAPFHYGRWVVVGGYWGWVPCAPRPRIVTVEYVRPVYAPALVAWVGGPHFSIGIGVGEGVAWFPLGPREVYIPAYRVSPAYVTRVNISNTTVNNTYVTNVYNNYTINKTVTNVTYVNRSAPNAVTATSQTAFAGGQPVSRNMIRVEQKQIASAPVIAATPGVAPQQHSVIGAAQEARVRPPATLQARAVVAKTAPPPAPVPFARQQQSIQANGGQPLARSEQLRLETPNQEVRRNVRIAPAQRRVAPLPANRADRPSQPNQPGNPKDASAPDLGRGNRPSQPGNQTEMVNPRTGNDRPPASEPRAVPPNNQTNTNVNRPPEAGPNRNNTGRNDQNDRNNRVNRFDKPPNPQLEQKQIDQQEKLRQQQDRERQRIDREQVQQQQKLEQKNADERRRQQVEEQQQRKLQQLEQKHGQEQQKLQQKQQQEEQKAHREQQQRQEREKPPKPPKDDNNDRPHGRQ